MPKKRIFIAYTGGTIGMKPSAKGFIPASGYLSDTLSKMPEFFREEMPDFELHEYDQLLDSSDIQPSDWMKIAQDIAQNYQHFDGFIILHGTDTMAYTASALSFIFENLQKPVIITGSQIPLAQLRSDGQANLLNALYIAANYPIPEVTLYFNNRLMRGNRARKVDADGFDAFDSPNFHTLLTAGIKIEAHVDIQQAQTHYLPLQLTRISSQAVGLISLYPGFSDAILDNILQQPVKALILMTYGVGNAPQNERTASLLKDAYANQIMVVNCTQCVRGTVDMHGYANGRWLADLGLISGLDMTPEAALAKLHYVLSRQDLSFQSKLDLMSQNLRGEMSL